MHKLYLITAFNFWEWNLCCFWYEDLAWKGNHYSSWTLILFSKNNHFLTMKPFFSRWFFSTNHKDIGTLYFIFGTFLHAKSELGQWDAYKMQGFCEMVNKVEDIRYFESMYPNPIFRKWTEFFPEHAFKKQVFIDLATYWDSIPKPEKNFIPFDFKQTKQPFEVDCWRDVCQVIKLHPHPESIIIKKP